MGAPGTGSDDVELDDDLDLSELEEAEPVAPPVASHVLPQVEEPAPPAPDVDDLGDLEDDPDTEETEPGYVPVMANQARLAGWEEELESEPTYDSGEGLRFAPETEEEPPEGLADVQPVAVAELELDAEPASEAPEAPPVRPVPEPAPPAELELVLEEDAVLELDVEAPAARPDRTRSVRTPTLVPAPPEPARPLEQVDTRPMRRVERSALRSATPVQEAPAASEPATQGEVPWRTLHPLSLLVNLLPQMWVLFQQVGWPVVLVMIAGGGLQSGFFVNGGLLLTFVGLATVRTSVHFLTLRYRVTGGRLEIRSGVIQRTRRAVELQKVQNVEIVRNLFHRVSGLAEVRIETASGDEVEGLLSALTVEEATRLRQVLQSARRSAPVEALAVATPIVQHTLSDLVRYGGTSLQFGGTAVVIGFLMEAMLARDPESAAATTQALGGSGIGLLFVAVVAGAWLVGLVGAVVRHHGYTLSRTVDGFTTEEGLFTTRRIEVPISKVQRVTVAEPWLRRLAGIATITIETAAARPGERGTSRALATVPVVDTARVRAMIQVLLPGLQAPVDEGLRPPAPIAGRRAVLRGFLRGSFFAAVVGGFFGWPWGLLALVLIPWSTTLAWLDFKHQGWIVTDDVVVARSGWLRRATTVVARSKLQSVDVDQGPMQRRYGLGEVVLRVAGGEVRMPVLMWGEAWALASLLSGSIGARAR